MNDVAFKSPRELQIELGERLRRIRLARNVDQRTAAERAGVSEKSLRNLENGRGSTVETLLRTLRALDAMDGLALLAPEVSVDPLALLHNAKAPQRVRRPRKPREALLHEQP